MSVWSLYKDNDIGFWCTNPVAHITQHVRGEVYHIETKNSVYYLVKEIG